MEIILTPEYSDLFPGEQDNLENLLKDISSILVIKMLALINAELDGNDKGQETQGKIFRLMLSSQPDEIRRQILEQANKKVQRNPNEKTHFFSLLYNMNFLHHELIQFRDLPEDELDAEQQLRLFKAYFLVVEDVNKEYRNTLTRELPNYDESYFGKMTWPTLIDQFELNYRTNPFHILIRGTVFLNYLRQHSPYAAYVRSYLERHGKATPLNYLFDIYQLLIAAEKKNRELRPGGWASCSIAKSTGFETLLEQFSLDRTAYAQTYTDSKSNYSGIKSKPLFSTGDGNWLVLNWGFLTNKMYEGLLFDFYDQSGIAQHPDFKKFIDFKGYVGGVITEKYLSQKLLRATFKNKYQALLFDDPAIPGFPDGYYRNGNNVILFELKDAYFPASAINSFSYETITRAIDDKMNTAKKGTGQLINQLKSLAQRPYEQPAGYKHVRNLRIFPVILYADVNFNLPGIDQYLESTFRKMVISQGLEKKFKKIEPVTFINLYFFIKNFDLLDGKNTSLPELIKKYHQTIAARKKKANRTRELANHLHVYETFEQVAGEAIPYQDPKRDYIAASLKAFDLGEGLPG